jgi:hypothetical protein
MSKQALMISAALVGLLAVTPAMSKGSLYTLPLVSGSTETISFGVNNDLVVTGFSLNSSTDEEDGFVGPASGTNYTVFDDSTDPDTQARAINDAGYIMGIDNSTSSATDYIPFERKPDGKITNVTMDGTAMNYLAQGINKKNVFTGSYYNSSSVITGYTGKKAKWQSDFTLPGITTTAVAGRGYNNKGDIVGWYEDSSGNTHGFYYPKGGTPVTVDDSAGITEPEGINNKGEISGIFTDSSGNRHGFTYDIKKQKFTELLVSGSTYVEVWGLNDNGVVDIDGENSSGIFVGYLYCPKASDCPSTAGRAPQVPVLHRPMRIPVQMP